MPPVLLDTDTLSQVMKGRDTVVALEAGAYLVEHGRFTFSLMTRYEVLRGLKARGASAQIASFEARCGHSTTLPITDAVIVRAAGLYADLKQRGALISDADLIIAATALEHSLALITGNGAHYRRIPRLAVESWAAA